ncbi:hypothetical protein CL622_09170 [archaeon]|nr:hypothetical protein [archaeon]
MSDLKSFIVNKPGKFFSESITDPDGAVTEKIDPTLDLANTSSIASQVNQARLLGTQQIDVDYSKFENHTFFNSAQVNVTTAFDTIINKFPFDGTKLEINTFIDSLTGFEKYVYDNIPKNTGYLNFSASSYISVPDKAGVKFKTLSKNISGDPLIDPLNKPFTFEAQIFLPPAPGSSNNKTQIIVQKLSGSNNDYNSVVGDRKGFTLMLSASETYSADIAQLHGYVVSGSAKLFITGALKRGEFSHVAVVYDKVNDELSQLRLYINSDLASTSSLATIGKFGSENSDFLIGSGSAFTAPNIHVIEQEQTFSGSIDELRFFHEARTEKQIKLYRYKTVFADDNLRLYYKFNEPTGALGNVDTSALNSVVLDSSGNSMHTYISNYHHTLRSTGSVVVPLKHERDSLNPVLFPSYTQTMNFNESLLLTASRYDIANPNLITNLIPRHYFSEGETKDGVDNFGMSTTVITGSSLPGSAKIGSQQILSSLLFIWAKQFDELKITLDAFKTLLYTDYESQENVPNVFLKKLMSHYGFNVPNLFTSTATLEELVDGENIIDKNYGTTSTNSLTYIQNNLLRRLLANIQHIIKNKGTLNGLKMLIRSTGIDPDKSIRIKTFGKSSSGQIYDSYQKKNVILTYLNLTSSAADCFITSSYLSGSRVEPGYPEIAGTYQFSNSVFTTAPGHGFISNNKSDGLYTSGSWTYECIYKLPTTRVYNTTQSLTRLITTGTLTDHTGSTDKGIVANLVALSSSNPVLRLYVQPSATATAADLPNPQYLSLSLTGSKIFDGKPWHVSFGRTRNDKINSHYSSSYFLRAASDVDELYVTSSLFCDNMGTNVFENIHSNYNASGLYIAIGNENDDSGYLVSSDAYFLNNFSIAPGESRARAFNGMISNIRFWSKDLTAQEWKEHIRNKDSLGVNNPNTNFCFEQTMSGSFEKLRTNVTFQQYVTESNASGKILLLDNSQNNTHFDGFDFSASSQIIFQDYTQSSFLIPNIDHGASVDKVRIRGFQQYKNISGSQFASMSPVHNIARAEEVSDDMRISIELSIIDALDADIIKMFSTLEQFNNYVSSPEMMFADKYDDIENIREVYFNRLTEKIHLKGFYKLFRYMDSVLSGLIEHVLPYKTKYFGTHLTIESHLLERAKVKHHYSDTYLTETEKQLPSNIYKDFNSST